MVITTQPYFLSRKIKTTHHSLNSYLLILFFCDKPNVYMHSEVIDIAEVFKSIIELVAV